MKDYNNSVIYIITIGNKKYVGSSANYKQRCKNYNSQFNRVLKNLNDIIELIDTTDNYNRIDRIKNDTLISIRKKHHLSINKILLEEFIINQDWKIEQHHIYKCNNNLELRCEEERTRLKIWKYDKTLNCNACVNSEELKKDNERIRMNLLTDEEIIEEQEQKIRRDIELKEEQEIQNKKHKTERNIYKDYRKYKERNGEEINFYDYNYLWCKKYGKYKIIINDGIHYELWGENKTHFKELTA